MSDFLRRLYNQVDSAFDRRTLEIEQRYSRPGGNAKRPVTAAGAFARVKPLASELDRGALLKSIVSQAGVDRNGASPRWEFAFDLPARRAQLYCVWSLPLEASADDYGPALVEVNTRPFPAPDGPLRLLAREGKLLNRQLAGLWKEELRRNPFLPEPFRDSDAAAADFVSQGLDLEMEEFSLRTGRSPEGAFSWIAETRYETYFAVLA